MQWRCTSCRSRPASRGGAHHEGRHRRHLDAAAGRRQCVHQAGRAAGHAAWHAARAAQAAWQVHRHSWAPLTCCCRVNNNTGESCNRAQVTWAGSVWAAHAAAAQPRSAAAAAAAAPDRHVLKPTSLRRGLTPTRPRSSAAGCPPGRHGARPGTERALLPPGQVPPGRAPPPAPPGCGGSCPQRPLLPPPAGPLPRHCPGSWCRQDAATAAGGGSDRPERVPLRPARRRSWAGGVPGHEGGQASAVTRAR